MEFVADLVGSLAWPVAALGAGWFLREPIRVVARNMQDAPVKRARVAGFEIEFGEVLAGALEDAAEISQEPGIADVDLSESEYGAFADLEELLTLSPRAAVLEAFARVEQALWELSRPSSSRIDLRHPGRETARTLAAKALDSGLVSKATFDAIVRLAQARNLVAHGATSALPEEAAEFISVAHTVLIAIDAAIDRQDRPDQDT